jgi:hypothetical protein
MFKPPMNYVQLPSHGSSSHRVDVFSPSNPGLQTELRTYVMLLSPSVRDMSANIQVVRLEINS